MASALAEAMVVCRTSLRTCGWSAAIRSASYGSDDRHERMGRPLVVRRTPCAGRPQGSQSVERGGHPLLTYRLVYYRKREDPALLAVGFGVLQAAAYRCREESTAVLVAAATGGRRAGRETPPWAHHTRFDGRLW